MRKPLKGAWEAEQASPIRVSACLDPAGLPFSWFLGWPLFFSEMDLSLSTEWQLKNPQREWEAEKPVFDQNEFLYL